jgi:hypothetical protein
MTGRSRVLVGLAAPAIVAVVVAWFVSSGRWDLVGIWVVPSVIDWPTGFGDLANVTDTADCLRADEPIEGCDPYGRPFQPYVVLPARVLAVLGLGLAQTGILGVALAALWVIVIGVVSTWIAVRWSRGVGELVIALAAVVVAGIAPPTLLGVERGSLDIVVVALALGGLLLIAATDARAGAGRWTGQAIGSLALAAAVVVKFFAVGVFAAFVAPRRWRLLPLIAAVLGGGWLLWNFDDVLLASRTAGSDVPSTTRIMFSATTGFVTLLTEDPNAFFPAEGQELPMGLLRVLGVLVVLLFALGFWLLLRRMPDAPYSSWLLITGGGFILLIPYVLGESNDYRLIVLLLPLAGLLRWRSAAESTGWLWVVVGLVVVALLTGSAMVPNEFGFLLPKPVLLLGDLALAGALGFTLAVWVMGWVGSRTVRAGSPT